MFDTILAAAPAGPTAPVVLAGDWINWASNKIAAVQNLFIAAIVVVAIYAVIKTYSRTQAIAPTAIALLVGALVVWAVANMTLLAKKTGTEITDTPAANPTSAAAPHRLGTAGDRTGLDAGRL